MRGALGAGRSGLVGFGGLAWATDLATAIVVAGAGMLLLGLFVAPRFSEHNFTPTREHRWRESLSILRRGVALVRADHQVLIVFGATLLVNAGGEAYEFLYAKRLLELGFPAQPDPIVWLTALGLAALAVGALALRIVEAHIEGVGVARRVYTAACAVGALGLLAVAYAPSDIPAMAGVLLVSGLAWPVTRSVSVVWVNRRASSDVRATMQSLLAQAEGFGELSAEIALGLLAHASSISVVLACSSALLACAGVLVFRSRTA